MNITKKFVSKLLSVVDQGLVNGLGTPVPGQMCVEAAVCYAQGLPHSDRPTCVGDAVRAFKIALNDADWSSDAARAAGMRKLAVAQLGSDNIDQKAFAKIVAEQTIRRVLPIALRNAANANPEHAEALNKAAKNCEELGTLDAANAAYDAANDAYDAAYAADAADAAYAAYAAYDAYDAANAAYYAVTHAVDAVDAVVYAVNAARYAVVDNDSFLLISADIALQALIQLDSPGCKFLYLCD